MKTATNWQEYDTWVCQANKRPPCIDWGNRIILSGVLIPGIVAWSKKDTLMEKVRHSAGQIQKAFNSSFSGAEIEILETPAYQNPKKEWERYAASLYALKNGLMCATVYMGLSFRESDKQRRAGLESYSQVPFQIMGSFPLGAYQENTKHFLKEAWGLIESLDFCTVDGNDFDKSFLIEVVDEKPIRGGKNLLRKLDLNLPPKNVHLPC